MSVPLHPLPAAHDVIGQTLIQRHDVDVDLFEGVAFGLFFGALGAGLVFASVVTVQALGLGGLVLGVVELALGAVLLYGGYGWIAGVVGNRRLKAELDGLHAHYGLHDVQLVRAGESVQTLPLEQGTSHVLGRWAPEPLVRLLRMRALLQGSDDEAMRAAAEFAAWSTFDCERQMRSDHVYIVREPHTGKVRWFDPRRDEDEVLRTWHEEGVPVFRVRLLPGQILDEGEGIAADEYDRVAAEELPVLVGDSEWAR